MQILLQLGIGAVMLIICVVLQALCYEVILRCTQRFCRYARHHGLKAMLLSASIGGVCVVLIIHMWLWVLLYLWVGGFNTLEEALYFSITAFTTVGFGDVVLPHNWRLLGAIEASCGFLLFGWSTAFIFELVTQIYPRGAS